MTAALLAAWWTQGVVLATMLAATAALLQRIARDAVPARAIWGAALLGSTLLTVSAPLRIESVGAPVAAIAAHATPSTAATTPDAGRLDPGAIARRWRRAMDAPAELAAAAAMTIADRTARRAFAAWWIVASALGLVLLVSHRRLRRMLRGAEVHVVADVPVRLTEDLGPAVVGVRDPVIAMPRRLLGLPAAEQALVVRHEQSHVAAGDPLLLMLGVALTALQPWNPVAWILLSRLRLAIELDCDRRLIRGGTPPRAYGDLLIALAAAASPATRPAVIHPMFSHHRSHLAQRIIAMTESPVRLVSLRRTTVALLAVAALLSACESKLPTDAEVATMDAAAAVRSVSGVAGIDPAIVRYFVDGVLATPQEAMAIPADRIATVSVRNGMAEIHISTDALVLRGDTIRISGTTAPGNAWRETGALPFAKGFTGVLVIDGVRVPNSRLNELSGDRIQSVEVIKGAAAVGLYGKDAETGAIVVRTRRAP